MDLTVKEIKDQFFWIHDKIYRQNGFRTTSHHYPNFLDIINKSRLEKIIPKSGKTVGGIFSFGQDYENILVVYIDRTIDVYSYKIPFNIINLISEHFASTRLPHAEAPTHQSPQTLLEPVAMPPAQPPSYSEQ
jgi:hypothetical protein